MDSLYFSRAIDDQRTLCLAPITERRLAMSSQKVEDTSGYFLYELSGNGEGAGVQIIARIVCVDAVDRMRMMLNLT